jgi:hypothetical protein
MNEDGPQLAVKLHPRAAASVARTRSLVALACFALAAAASHMNGAGAMSAAARALGAGVIGWYVGWAAAVTVWRHVMLAEIRAEVRAITDAQARSQKAPS